MGKSSKKQIKINFTKYVSITIGFLLVIFLFFAIFSTPSFESDNHVLNHTVIHAEDLFFTYEVDKYPTAVEISNITERNLSIGFSLETSSLNFGVVPTGGNMGKRFLTLKNTEENNAKIQFVAYGDISQMIQFSDNDFNLVSDELKQVDIVLETELDTQVGNYSGEIDLVIKRAKYGFLEWFI
ncbi:MAG: hypothetical protein GQ477_03415 [Nanohaloarchaea archaeon]|nr:hypothetical protein [Candidatus Nanohaloarchaea archaeon]